MITMKEIVDREIEEFKQTYKSRKKEKNWDEIHFAYFFNNFFAYLPYSSRRTAYEKGYEGVNEYTKRSDNEHRIEGYRKEKTSKEFYEEVDKVIKEKGIDLSKIEMMQKRDQKLARILHRVLRKSKWDCLEKIRQEGNRNRAELYKLAFPVYLHLREMGYTKLDLAG